MGCRKLSYWNEMEIPTLRDYPTPDPKINPWAKELTPKNTAQNARSSNLYQYSGKERDEESGMYYYGARYYAPWTCRFVSVDPLAADYPQLTPYNYAGNKPVTHKDLDGLQGTGDTKQGGNSGGGSKGSGGAKLPVENGLPTVHLKPVKITGVRIITDKAIKEMGMGKEISILKAGTNYEAYSNPEDFSNLGTYVKNPIQYDKPFYPPNPEIKTDRKTYYNDLFIANKNYNFYNFASVTVGNFISGNGPENTVFGKNHPINQFMKQIDIVREAVSDWKKTNVNLPFKKQSVFNHFIDYSPGQSVMDLIDSFFINREFATPEQVIGGANVKITPIKEGLLEIRIFNVTSLGSGNIGGNIKSYIRQPNYKGSQAYRNISQTFIFNYRWK